MATADAHPAAELIEQARFARRMLDVVAVEVDKIVAAAQPAPPAGPTRLEVPTVNLAGWTDAVLYVIRTERAKTTPAREIAAMLERLFGVEASAHVVMSAVLHFGLDRREDASPAEWLVPPGALESVTFAPPAVGKGFVAADMAVSVATGEVAPVAAPASVEDKAPRAASERDFTEAEDALIRTLWLEERSYSLIALALADAGHPRRTRSAISGRVHRLGLTRSPKPDDTAWIDEAKRLYADGRGMAPFAIAKQLGRTDYEVRKAVIPGYGTREHRDNIRAQMARPAPSLPPVSRPKPQPREPKTKPERKPVERRAVSKEPLGPLWTPSARPITGVATAIPDEGKGIHLLDLKAFHCRWPMGRGADGHETYCGCQKSPHGSSYCEAHAKRAYREWPPSTPVPKLPTRMARRLSTLPAQQNRNAQRRA
ncbi:GcrA family cell cycle regulator [Ancylobacter sp. VNQ12]|uniref:GcrA family cell cycle regulator n=1 Tax=Ancylobacter sp. VNQ12 TaxID=3400920 RepID=UPI003C004AB7